MNNKIYAIGFTLLSIVTLGFGFKSSPILNLSDNNQEQEVSLENEIQNPILNPYTNSNSNEGAEDPAIIDNNNLN